MQIYLIKNIHVVNENSIVVRDVLIKNGRIERVAAAIDGDGQILNEINGEGKYLLPGVIDDQVHFREPGLTHKATIYTESKAAVAGGVTSFMEMPNTVPNALTQELLEDKYEIAAANSLANYSFYMGTGNDNADEVLKTNDKRKDVCGIKIFMGSSTGNMLVDNPGTLDKIFSEAEVLIATHCENEKIIKDNFAAAKQSGKLLTAADHPLIRNEEACFTSSSYAVSLAKKYNTRLHILHITTAKELELFTKGNIKEKRITSEVCVHHLHFTSDDYTNLDNLIKCNPAIKAPGNKESLWSALLDDRLDVIATDHAPHTLEEKGFFRDEDFMLKPIHPEATDRYEKAHAGLPLVQHGLLLMIEYYKTGRITLEKIVEKMSHSVAACFQISERGYIREGYYADLVILDLGLTTTITKNNILYKCAWSPLEGTEFAASITHCFVNGHLVYGNGRFDESKKGKRLTFER